MGGTPVVTATAAPPPQPPPRRPCPARPIAAAAPPEDPAQHGRRRDLAHGRHRLPAARTGRAAFVSVGDKVSEGQTLLIVEAMKTMNQIPSPPAGTVKRILVEDKSAVEYGAPLMIIE
jgi:acetyl-CoA carboxylase biotin carboxyl carrier protein